MKPTEELHANEGRVLSATFTLPDLGKSCPSSARNLRRAPLSSRRPTRGLLEACREFPFNGQRAIRQCERRSLPIAGASCRWEAPDLGMWRRGFLR